MGEEAAMVIPDEGPTAIMAMLGRAESVWSRLAAGRASLLQALLHVLHASPPCIKVNASQAQRSAEGHLDAKVRARDCGTLWRKANFLSAHQ